MRLAAVSSTHSGSNATLWETRHFSGIRSINGSTHRTTLPLKHEPTGSVPRAMLRASLPPALLSPPTGSLRPCTAQPGHSVPGAQTEFNCRKPQDEPQPVPDSPIHNWRRAAVGTSALTGYKPALTGLHRFYHTKSTNLDKTSTVKRHAWHTCRHSGFISYMGLLSDLAPI